MNICAYCGTRHDLTACPKCGGVPPVLYGGIETFEPLPVSYSPDAMVSAQKKIDDLKGVLLAAQSLLKRIAADERRAGLYPAACEKMIERIKEAL